MFDYRRVNLGWFDWGPKNDPRICSFLKASCWVAIQYLYKCHYCCLTSPFWWFMSLIAVCPILLFGLSLIKSWDTMQWHPQLLIISFHSLDPYAKKKISIQINQQSYIYIHIYQWSPPHSSRLKPYIWCLKAISNPSTWILVSNDENSTDVQRLRLTSFLQKHQPGFSEDLLRNFGPLWGLKGGGKGGGN